MSGATSMASWLVAFDSALVAHPDRRERILAETEDHLRDSVAARTTAGGDPESAERQVVAAFGDPEETAAELGPDVLGSVQARWARAAGRFDRWRPRHPWLGAVPTAAALMAAPTLAPLASGGPASLFTVLSFVFVWLAVGVAARAVPVQPGSGFWSQATTWRADRPVAAGWAMAGPFVGIASAYAIAAVAHGHGLALARGLPVVLMMSGFFVAVVVVPPRRWHRAAGFLARPPTMRAVVGIVVVPTVATACVGLVMIGGRLALPLLAVAAAFGTIAWAVALGRVDRLRRRLPVNPAVAASLRWAPLVAVAIVLAASGGLPRPSWFVPTLVIFGAIRVLPVTLRNAEARRRSIASELRARSSAT